jgi:hypothetical protein
MNEMQPYMCQFVEEGKHVKVELCPSKCGAFDPMYLLNHDSHNFFSSDPISV